MHMCKRRATDFVFFSPPLSVQLKSALAVDAANFWFVILYTHRGIGNNNGCCSFN